MGPGGQQPLPGSQGPQGQFQGRGGGGRFGNGQQGAPPAPQAQVQAQPQFQNRQERGRGGYDNQGGRYGGYQGAPQAPAQPQYQNRQDRAQGGYDNRAYDNRGGGDVRNRGGGQGYVPGNNAGRNFDRDRGYDRGGNVNRGDNRYRGGDNYNRGGQRFAYRGRDFFRFRSDPYIWPRGYSSRSWGVRQILPSFFLMDRYYIDNFWDYGFDEPPYGYRWVRVGDDALLVNVYSGQIIDVVPGVFYY
jgi:Ni/Co efflux regulator RcnB